MRRDGEIVVADRVPPGCVELDAGPADAVRAALVALGSPPRLPGLPAMFSPVDFAHSAGQFAAHLMFALGDQIAVAS